MKIPAALTIKKGAGHGWENMIEDEKDSSVGLTSTSKIIHQPIDRLKKYS